MSLLRTFMLAALVSFLISNLSAQESELQQIENTLNLYLEGGTNNNYYQLARAFHKGATMKYINDQGYQQTNALEFFSESMKPGPRQNRLTRIKSVNISGHAASAHLEIEYPTFTFQDHMNLLKINDEWKIVNKIFYRQEKETLNSSPDPGTYVNTTTEQSSNTTSSNGIPTLEEIIRGNSSSTSSTSTTTSSPTSTNTSTTSTATNANTIGRWAFAMNGMDGQIEIQRLQNKYYSLIKYENGQSHQDELYTNGNRIMVKNSIHGEYYMLRTDGNLDVYSRNGYLTTCRLMR